MFKMETTDSSVSFEAQSKVQSILVCNTVLLLISTVGLLFRLFVRIRYLTGICLDDWFCAISWVFTLVLCFVCIWMTRYGYGRHIETIHDVATRDMFLKLDFVTEITYLLALGTIKISFCLTYLKIFPGPRFQVLCQCLMALVIAETIEETVVVIFQCSPVHKAWDSSGKVQGKCLSLLAFYYISFGIRLATDIALFALPIPKLMQLKMTVGKRAGLLFMFGLGILVCVTSIIRATYLNNFSDDHTWTLVNTLNWSSVEVAVAIFIASIPSFKALISFQFPAVQRLLGLSSKGNSTARSRVYGASTTHRTADRRSLGANRAHRNHFKLTNITTNITTADLQSSRNGSEEHIIRSHSPGAIQVTTDVVVKNNASSAISLHSRYNN